MKPGKIALCVLAGFASGALIGILLAPEKGTRTRRQILRKGEDLTDELKDKYVEFIDSIVDKYECTRNEAESFFYR